MTAALAQHMHNEDGDFCMACSRCEMLLPVALPSPGTTLLELRCPRCGTSDVYHVNTLRFSRERQGRQ